MDLSFRPKLFASYRNLESEKIKEFKDCARLNPECMTPHEEEAAKVSSVEVNEDEEKENDVKEIKQRRVPMRKRIWRL